MYLLDMKHERANDLIARLLDMKMMGYSTSGWMNGWKETQASDEMFSLLMG